MPATVTPWAYNLFEWTERPEMDEDIQAVLVEHLMIGGATSHDVGGGVDDEEFVFVGEEDAAYPESMDGSIGDVTEQMQNLESSLRDPSTAGTSTSSSSTATGSGGRRGGSFASAGGMPND